MENISIKVYVPKNKALARNSTKYGEAFVELEDADVAKLSDPAKYEITAHHQSIYVDEATPSCVCLALEALAVKREEEEQAYKKRMEDNVQKFLALTWKFDSYFGGRPTATWAPYAANCPSDDPRVRAKLESLNLQLKEAQAAYDVIEHVPEYSRAAKEGKNVMFQAVKHCTDMHYDLLRAGKSKLNGISAFRADALAEKDLATPSNTAYETRDAVQKALKNAKALDVSFTTDIVRVDRPMLCTDVDDWDDSAAGEENWCVAIKITATFPLHVRYAYVLAE
jgi:hypothetical protein